MCFGVHLVDFGRGEDGCEDERMARFSTQVP